MGLSEYTLELVSKAIRDNAFCDLLCGNPPYKLSDRDGYLTTDRSVVLFSGIYRYYKRDHAVKIIFEKALLQLMYGSAFELMTAFDYIWRCRLSEMRSTAPFSLEPECLAAMKQALEERKAELEQYKDLHEFGKSLPGGAWEYAQNVAAQLRSDAGTSLWG